MVVNSADKNILKIFRPHYVFLKQIKIFNWDGSRHDLLPSCAQLRESYEFHGTVIKECTAACNENITRMFVFINRVNVFFKRGQNRTVSHM